MILPGWVALLIIALGFGICLGVVWSCCVIAGQCSQDEEDRGYGRRS